MSADRIGRPERRPLSASDRTRGRRTCLAQTGDRTDYARALLVLEGMEQALTERSALDRAVAEAVQASDAGGIERAVEAAESNMRRLQALLSELDVYWPRRPDGLREEDGAPEPLLEAAERVRDLIETTAREGAASTDRLRERRDEIMGGLRSIRVTRRTGAKYRAPKGQDRARMFDARR